MEHQQQIDHQEHEAAEKQVQEEQMAELSQAERFIKQLDNTDTDYIMNALDEQEVPSEQFWDDEATEWTFEDGSIIRVSGNDVFVIGEGDY